MRFFAVIVLIAAVASAQANSPSVASVIAHLLETIAALKPESVAVGPAIVESEFEPIAIGPAIVDSVFEPIAVGPALVDFPMPDGGVAVEPVVVPSPAPVAPSPVSIIHGPADDVSTDGSPLVQIILNIKQAAAEHSPIAVAPVVIPQPVKPEPVQVVETAPVIPIAVNPIGVVAPEPVQVVETAPVAVEPVIIGTPIIPEAAVILPEELN